MTCLPLLYRELRLRSRRASTFWLRAAVGGIILLSCLPYLLAPLAANMGLPAFTNMTVAAFLLCCASGLMSADAISSERREQTLGLLFLTRVRSLDLLLGKFGAAGLSGLGAVLTLLPLLMVPVLMGGVTGGEAARKGLALVSTLWFSLSVGLFSSTSSAEWKRTALRTLLILALFIVLPCVAAVTSSGPPIVLVNPVATFIAASDGFYRKSPQDYWISLVLTQGLSWGFLIAAALQLKRSWRTSALEGRPQEPAVTSVSVQRAVDRVGDKDPIEWVVRRNYGTVGAVWVAILVQVFLTLLVPLALSTIRFNPALIWSMNLLNVAASLIWGSLIVFAASRFFISGHRSGNLELLQTTPVGAEQIIQGQWNALKRALQGPVIVLMLSLIVPFLQWGLPRTGYEFRALLVSILWLAINAFGLWLKIVAFVWAGLWFGLKTRNLGPTIAWSLLLVEGVPYVIQSTTSLVGYSIGIWQSFKVLGIPVAVFAQQAVVIAIWYWIIQWSKRKLSEAIHAGHGDVTSVRQDLVDTARRIVTDFQMARHWTRAPRN